MRSQDRVSFCHARLPRAGLGNKLLVWARAFVFAELNRLPLVVTGWTQPQLSPFLRGGDLRFYLNYFRRVREVGFLRRLLASRSATIVREPELKAAEWPGATIFDFTEIPHWSDYFRDLKAHRERIKQGLFDLLTSTRRKEFARSPKPLVCLQVRMADFRSLESNEDFAKVGNVRTPLQYFARMISDIRQLHGTSVPVTVVSDGQPSDLADLLKIPAVTMGPRNSAIVEILKMASSKVLIPSAGSTFGLWGGFLGDCALIMHPDHIHKPIRSNDTNARFYEGPAVRPPNEWPELLRRNIAAI